MSADITPIPVHVTGSDADPGGSEAAVFRAVSRALSPDVGSDTTFPLTTSPVTVVPRDDRRFRAILLNSGATGTVLYGTKSQVGAGGGGTLGPGNKVELYSGMERCAAAQSGTATLTVTIETFSYDY